jgi:hypothetical protein
MPRLLNGAAHIVAARKQVKLARTADELRAAQAVLLPLDLGLSIAQTARAIGRSAGVASRLRNGFGKASAASTQSRLPTVRSPAKSALTRERALLAAALRDVSGTGTPSVARIKVALELRTGTTMSLATVYRTLARHGWRKNEPFSAALLEDAPDDRLPRSSAKAAA